MQQTPLLSFWNDSVDYYDGTTVKFVEKSGLIGLYTALKNVPKSISPNDSGGDDFWHLDYHILDENTLSKITTTEDGLKLLFSKTEEIQGQFGAELQNTRAEITIQADKIASKVSTDEFATTIEQTAKAISLKADQYALNDLGERVTANTAQLVIQADKIEAIVANTDLTILDQRFTALETRVTQTADQIELKADKLDVDGLLGRVEDAEASLTIQAGQIQSKVSQTIYDNFVNATTQELLDKANAGDLAALAGRITTAETAITQTAEQIELKADKTVIDGLEDRIEDAEASLTVQAGQIQSKVSQTIYDQFASDITAEMGTKAGSDELAALAGRVTTAETSITQTAQQIALKADKDVVDNIAGRVSSAEAALIVQAGQILSKVSQTDHDLLSNRIASAESAITQNADNIELRVAKTDFTGQSIMSRINIDPTTILIEGSKINLVGQVTYNSFSNGLKTSFDALGDQIAILNDTKDYVDNVLPGILTDLEGALDGVAEQHFYNVDPTLTNMPAVDWTTPALKEAALGDLYYNTANGKSFRWVKEGGTYLWKEIVNADLQAALAKAAEAKDTADSKRRVFTITPFPPYDQGDLWVQGPTGDIMRAQTARIAGQNFVVGDWVKASKYTDDSRAVLAETNAIAAAATDATNKAEAAKTHAQTLVNSIQVGATNLALNSRSASDFVATGAGTGTKVAKTDEAEAYTTYTPDAGKTVSLRGYANSDYSSGPFSGSIYLKHNHSASVTINFGGVSTVVPRNVWYYVKAEPIAYGAQQFHLLTCNVASVAVSIKKFKFEKGNKATDWTPAPVEVDLAIKAAQDAADAADAARLTLANSLKAMAFEDRVELARLGSTIIEGGYIKTNLLDVLSIRANFIDAAYINTLALEATTLKVGSPARQLIVDAQNNAINTAQTTAQNLISGIKTGSNNILLKSNVAQSKPSGDATYRVAVYNVADAYKPLVASKVYTLVVNASHAGTGSLTAYVGSSQNIIANSFKNETGTKVFQFTVSNTAEIQRMQIHFYNTASGSTDACGVNWVCLYEGALTHPPLDWVAAEQDNIDRLSVYKSEVITSFEVMDGKIASKVSQSDFNALGQRVGTAETSITQNASEIASKASKTELTTAIASLPLGSTNLLSLVDVLANNYTNVANTNLVSYKFVGKPNTEYTLSTNLPKPTSSTYDVFFGNHPSVPNSATNGVANNEPRTVKTGASGLLEITFRNLAAINAFKAGTYNIQLEAGATASVWVPNAKDIGQVQKDLIVTVSQAQTDITQNADQIALRATKTEVSTAKAEAISTAAGDATTKANNAVATAQTYTNSQITIANNAIALKAEKTVVDDIGARLSSAELKILPDAIRTTVKGQTETLIQESVSAIQLGGTNILNNSNGITHFGAYSGSTLAKSVVSVPEWGAADANRIISTGGTHVMKAFAQLYVPAINEVVTTSIWIKNNGSTTLTIRSNQGARVATVAAGAAQRVVFEGIVGNGTGQLQFQIHTAAAGTNADFTWWRMQLEAGNKVSDWSPSVGDVQGQIDSTTSRITTAETQINQNKDQIALRATKTEVETQINEVVVVKDTRTTNQNPTWYYTNYPSKTVRELKTASVIGLTGSSLAQVTTIVPGVNATFGSVIQEALLDTKLYQRSGTSTTWSAWTESESTTGSQAKATAAQTAAKTYTDSQITIANDAITAKADKTVVTALETRLNTAELKITPDAIRTTVRAQTETLVNDAVGAINTASRNLLLQSNVPLVKVAGDSVYLMGSYTVAAGMRPLVVGQKYTLVIKGSNSGGAGTLGVWVNGQQQIKTNLFVNETNVVKTLVFTVTNTAVRTALSFYHYPSGAAGASSVEWACLYEGDITKPSLDWTPAPEDASTEIGSLQTRVTTAESSITQQADLIATKVTQAQVDTTVNNAVDNISIGGRNILKNSVLIVPMHNNGAIAPIVNTTVTEGDRTFIRTKRTNLAAGSAFSIYNGIPAANLTMNPKGEKVTVSFMARVSQVSTWTIYVDTYTPSAFLLGGQRPSIEIGLDWKQYSFTIPSFPDITTIGGFRVTPLVATGFTDLATFYLDICEFKFEVGNKATAWTPAPEDIANDLSSLTTRVVNTESSITQQAGLIATKVSQNEVDTTVSKAVADIQVGGRNLLLNSNGGGAYFNGYSGATVTRTINTISVPEWGATDATRVVSSGGTHAIRVITAVGTPKVGEVVTASGWFKNNGTTAFAVNSNQGARSIRLEPGEQKRIVFEGIVGNGSGSVQFQVNPVVQANNVDFIWWRLQYEMGNKVSDWSPAPEDIEGAVTVLTTRVSNAETTITQNKDQIALRATKTELTTSVNGAISTAANDATSKANNARTNAVSSAKTYTDSQITIANNAIALKAEKTVVDDLNTRMNAAEIKITPEAINLTVRDQIESTKIGKIMFNDPTFLTGTNGLVVYNNNNNNAVTMTRESVNGSQPTGTPWRLKIVTTDGTLSNPNWGGIRWGFSGRNNGTFNIKLNALVPVGRNIIFGTNSLGAGAVSKWLTSNAGTGVFTDYVYQVTFGTGAISTTGFFSIAGGATPTAAAPLTWYVAYATVFDLNNENDIATNSDLTGAITRITNAETQINQNKDQIALRATKTELTTLSNTVDNIRIGGKNLLRNSAEIPLPQTSSTTNQTLEENGVKFVRTTLNTNNAYSYFWLNNFPGGSLIRNYPETYTFSADLRAANASSAGKIYRFYIRTNAVAGAHELTQIPVTLTENWQRFSVTLKITKEFNNQLFLWGTDAASAFTATTGNILDLRYPQLELGNQGTDWSPAPEDISSQLTTLTTKITAAELKITDDAIKQTVRAQTETITKDAIDSLNIGGRNYLSTAKFNLYATYYTGSLVDGLLTATRVSTSTSTLVFTCIGFNNAEFLKGEFTFSGFVKINGAIPASLPLGKLNTQGSSTHVKMTYDPVTGYYTHTHRFGSGTTWFVHTAIFDVAVGGVITIKDAKFEKGNIATAYSPAFEDQEAATAALANRMTTAESSITSTANSITQKVWQTEIDRSISDLVIGGSNLMRDSLLKDGAIYGTPALGTMTRTVRPDQSDIIRINKTSGSNGTFGWQNKSTDVFSVEQGVKYTISMDIRGNLPGLNYAFLMRGEGANVNVLSTIDIPSTTFKRVTKTFTAPWNSDTAYIMLSYTGTAIGYFDITNIKVERGEKATDYTPNSLDLVDRLKTAEASIVTHANQIALRVTQTEIDNSINKITTASRNLLLNSNVRLEKKSTETKYQLGGYIVAPFINPLPVSKTFTLVVKGSNSGAGTLGVWVNGSQSIKSDLISNETNVVKTIVFTRNTNAALGSGLYFYHYPDGAAGTSSVEWACLYEGDITKPTLDWLPAPEDTQNELIKVGGRNLIYGGFENGQWDQAAVSQTANDAMGRTKNVFGLKVGEEYTFSMKEGTVVNPGRIWFTFRNANDTWHSALIRSEVPFTFVAPAPKCTITFNAGYYTAGLGAFVFERQEPKLELGNKVTGWTPAPEDVDARMEEQVKSIEVGGTNTFSNNPALTTVIAVGSGGTVNNRNSASAPNGFAYTGVSGGGGGARIQNVITGNGWWTVSGWVRGSQSIAINCTLDICDMPSELVIRTTTDNTWTYFSHSVNVTNYTSAIYNFVDFGKASWATFWFKDIKVEKGNKATDWTPHIEDAKNAAVQEAIEVKDTRDANESPSWYFANYPRRIVLEFKNLTKVGLSGTYGSTYGRMTTTVPWTDSSGGSIIQELTVDNRVFVRHGATSTWTAWLESESIVGSQAKATAAQAAAKSYTDGQISNVTQSVTTLQNTMNGSFQDGIIDRAEAIAIEKHINSLNVEKLNLDNQYNNVYGHVDLVGTAKTNLASAKTSYNSNHATLINSINNAIADNKVTTNEKTAVNSNFTNYRNALGLLSTRLSEALTSIADKQKADAIASANATSKSYVDNYITVNDRAVAAKASTTTVTALTNRVNAAELLITDAAINLTVKTQTQNIANQAAAATLATGKMLHKDPSFLVGANDIAYYPSTTGTVMTRVNDQTDSPSKDSIAYRFHHTGMADTFRCSLFSFRDQSRASAVIITRIVAKLPVGWKIADVHNSFGDPATRSATWLTPTEGTGMYEEYVLKIVCGATPGTGGFSTINHFDLRKVNSSTPTPTAAAPITSYVAWATSYDMSDIFNTPSEEEIKAGISITSNTINVFGQALSLTGKVTFASLDTSSQNTINTSSNNAAAAKALTDTWKFGNTTEIDGGNLRTNTITVEKIIMQGPGVATAGNYLAGRTSAGTAGAVTTLTDGNKLITSSFVSFGTAGTGGVESGYIHFDLGAVRPIRHSKLYFYSLDDRTYGYKIKYSTDNVNWYYAVGDAPNTAWMTSAKKSVTGATRECVTEDIFSIPFSARYVRVYGNGNTINSTNHLIQWELYGAIQTTLDGSGIVAGSILANQIAANAITATHIAAGTITATELASNSITTAKIAANQINAGHIIANAITATHIAAGTITATEIAAATITGAKIAAGTITADKINVDNLVVRHLRTAGTPGSTTDTGGRRFELTAKSSAYMPNVFRFAIDAKDVNPAWTSTGESDNSLNLMYASDNMDTYKDTDGVIKQLAGMTFNKHFSNVYGNPDQVRITGNGILSTASGAGLLGINNPSTYTYGALVGYVRRIEEKVQFNDITGAISGILAGSLRSRRNTYAGYFEGNVFVDGGLKVGYQSVIYNNTTLGDAVFYILQDVNSIINITMPPNAENRFLIIKNLNRNMVNVYPGAGQGVFVVLSGGTTNTHTIPRNASRGYVHDGSNWVEVFSS